VFCIIFVTCRSKKEADTIALSILKKRLASCANIIPGIDSRFWWNGKLDRSREFLIMVKTIAKNFRRVEREVKRIHSYEVPEIIAVPIAAGSKDYLKWIRENQGQ
jgi:periplasmic divalent cation tolerance protein